MLHAFFSWYDGWDTPPARELYLRVRDLDVSVDHSPHSPHSGREEHRWPDWYSRGLPQAIQQADVFVAVITPSCDASTWMLVEYQEAFDRFRAGGKPQLCYARFEPPDYHVRYPDYYLDNSIQLPVDVAEAARIIASLTVRLE